MTSVYIFTADGQTIVQSVDTSSSLGACREAYEKALEQEFDLMTQRAAVVLHFGSNDTRLLTFTPPLLDDGSLYRSFPSSLDFSYVIV